MCYKSYLFSTSARGGGNFFLLSLALVVCVGGLFLTGGAEGAEGEPLPDKSSPETMFSLGPAVTDFNTPWFKVSKVVRIERSLNALGIAAQFGKANKVGKYVELPKRLDSSERGEHFIITWKCSPKRPRRRATVKYEVKSEKPSGLKPEIMLPPEKAVLQFDYKLSNEEHLETITREYPNLRKGTYRLRIENTGTSYRRRGRIEYWRVRIFADGESVARKESFLWPAFRSGEETGASEGS
jgi:hypothetical protein